MTLSHKRDFIEEQHGLSQRVRNLRVGVTKPRAHMGGIGRNTNWHTASLRTAYKGTAETKVEWRVRADAVYFQTTGLVVLTTSSTTIALFRLGKAARPSRAMFITVGGGQTCLRVEPDGNVYYVTGNLSFRLGAGAYALA